MDQKLPDWDPYAPGDLAERMAGMDAARERSAVAHIAQTGGSYEILRYEDITAAARDPALFSNAGGPRHERRLPPLEYDPPEHGAYRAMLQPFFAPARMRALEPRVREIATSLLAPLVGEAAGDFAKGYSYPLPVLGLCAQLGVDGGDWPDIKVWSEGTLHAESADPDLRALALASHERILAYGRRLIAERVAHPRPPEDDLICAMIAAAAKDAPLDQDFMAYVLRLFISAGHNSTTSALGNALLHLAEHPDDQARLRAEPGLIPLALEEFLRLYTPVQEMPRWATRDAEVGGCPIPRGARVGMVWASGNRDEAAFPEAGRCVFDRRPNRHLAFGHGVHTCLGAPMARLELRVALEELLSRTKHFEICGPVERPPFRRLGVSALPLKLTLA